MIFTWDTHQSVMTPPWSLALPSSITFIRPAIFRIRSSDGQETAHSRITSLTSRAAHSRPDHLEPRFPIWLDLSVWWSGVSLTSSSNPGPDPSRRSLGAQCEAFGSKANRSAGLSQQCCLVTHQRVQGSLGCVLNQLIWYHTDWAELT